VNCGEWREEIIKGGDLEEEEREGVEEAEVKTIPALSIERIHC
jgi:hypothetical protein